MTRGAPIPRTAPARWSRRELLQRGGAIAGLVVVGGVLAACGDPREDIRRLAFLNWQDYIDPAILHSWERREDATVTYETYASNDDLAKRLGQAERTRRGGRAGAATFDLIVPSDNFVVRFRDDDQIQRIDHGQLANLDNLSRDLRDPSYDPGDRYSVPWATGSTGIGYDTKVFDEPPSYDVFLDEAHRGRVTVLDETRDAFGLALLSLGDDPNTRDPKTIDRAADRLIEMKKVIRNFDSASYLKDLASGRLVAAQGYSSDVALARKDNPDLAFTIPEAGGLRWVDAMAIPADAPHEDLALSWIDYYLRPDIAAKNSVAIQADTGNAGARKHLPQHLLDDPIVFPPPAVLARLTFTDDLGAAESLYDEAWTRVQRA